MPSKIEVVQGDCLEVLRGLPADSFDALVTRVCPECGVSYSARAARLRWGRETTCSRACSYARRARALSKSVTIQCGFCRKVFERPPNRNRGKYGANFCSPKCHYAGRTMGITKRIVVSPYRITPEGRAAWIEGAKKTRAKRIERDNYRHTESSKAKLSLATTRAISERRRFVSSGLEVIVAAELRRLGIPFVPQHVFRASSGRFAAVVDFWLRDSVALEVNGTFWHADPRVYPVPKGDLQTRCVARYERKLRLLAELGIRVVEVWELDLRRDPQGAVENGVACAFSN